MHEYPNINSLMACNMAASMAESLGDVTEPKIPLGKILLADTMYKAYISRTG